MERTFLQRGKERYGDSDGIQELDVQRRADKWTRRW